MCLIALLMKTQQDMQEAMADNADHDWTMNEMGSEAGNADNGDTGQN